MLLTEEMKECDLEEKGNTKCYKYDTLHWLLA